jgi:3-oxoadipate enol-lactonase
VPQKYLSVDGVATLVHHRGPTTLPGRPPATSQGEVVVCLHDAGDNGNSFAGLLDALAASHSPLAYDRPGHGRSGSLDSIGSVDAMVTQVRTLSAAFGLEHPVLVGDGLGAAVALEAAAADPAWPRALVLLGGAGADFDGLDAIVDELRRITSGKARRAFDNTGYAPDTPKEVFQKAFGEWVRTDPRATLGDRLAQQAWDRRGRLGAVGCPVTIVVGEHEGDDARRRAEALAAELPRATVVTLPGAGRHGVIEQPAALAGIVDAAASTATEVTR